MVELMSWRVILIWLMFGLSGCDNIIAHQFVEAPNDNLAIRGKDAPADVLAEHHVWRQLRINVGPPPASLSVWIVQPISGPGLIEVFADSHHHPVVQVAIAPQTQPSTVSSTNPAEVPKATLFLLHGWGDDKELAPYELYSLILASEGNRVVLVDFRGHGRSTGDYITYGARESRDLVQVLDELQRQKLVAGNVGAIGISYGASVAIMWASIDSRVRAVVALEPFSSIRDTAVDAGPILLGSARCFFSHRDLQDIATRVGRIAGFDPDRDSPLAAIARMTTPVLLIHGKADRFLHPEHSIRLHEAALTHSKLILVDGADHLDLWFKGLVTIVKESNDWFDRYLPTQTSSTTRR